MKHAIKHRGFTLIELLVVVAIMGMLMGLVAISNRPSRKTQLRQAAQSVASLIIATQSNALGSDVGSALWISDDGIYDANPQQNKWLNPDPEKVVCASSHPDTQKPYCQLQYASGSPIPFPEHACRVRFISRSSSTQPPSPWFDVDVNSSCAMFSSSQTSYNTIWPARFYSDPTAPQCNAEFDLSPLKTGLAYQWPKLAKIDWRYSGIGSTASLPADTAIAFDGGGKIISYFAAMTGFTAMPGSPTYVPAIAPLYLCIAYEPDVRELEATLDSEDTVWVAINPNTGRASLGWNAPTVLGNIAAPTSTELANARTNVVAGRGLAN
jgi:prepilin-type N-terminal cleavage/methylation domain-containing protein